MKQKDAWNLSNRYKLDEFRFKETDKNQFTNRVVDEWNKLCRYVVNANKTVCGWGRQLMNKSTITNELLCVGWLASYSSRISLCILVNTRQIPARINFSFTLRCLTTSKVKTGGISWSLTPSPRLLGTSGWTETTWCVFASFETTRHVASAKTVNPTRHQEIKTGKYTPFTVSRVLTFKLLLFSVPLLVQWLVLFGQTALVDVFVKSINKLMYNEWFTLTDTIFLINMNNSQAFTQSWEQFEMEWSVLLWGVAYCLTLWP